MTNALDLKFQPKVWATVQAYGIDATFYTYPSRSIDKTTSTVTEGTAVTFTVKITPPEDYRAKLARSPLSGESNAGATAGMDEESQVMKTFLASGVGQAPIGFTPTLGQRVDFGGKSWRVLQLTAYQPGDDVVGWELLLAE